MEIAIASRRHLPHIGPRERALFITFCTVSRWRLPPGARTLALRHALVGHGSKYYVHVLVVMPDHVHIVLALHDGVPLSDVMKGIKGVSARRINQLLCRSGSVWLDESFDHVIRRSEGLRQKCEYVAQNPVRAGLAATPDDYPWLWRVGIEGPM